MPPKTSTKAAAKSGKATKTVAKGDKKKRKGKRKKSYASKLAHYNKWWIIACSFLCSNPALPQVHDHLPGDPDRRAPDAARGARQARHVRGTKAVTK